MSSPLPALARALFDHMAATTSTGRSSQRTRLPDVMLPSLIGVKKAVHDVVRVEYTCRCVQITHDVVVRGTVVRVLEFKSLTESETNVTRWQVVGANRANRGHAHNDPPSVDLGHTPYAVG